MRQVLDLLGAQRVPQQATDHAGAQKCGAQEQAEADLHELQRVVHVLREADVNREELQEVLIRPEQLVSQPQGY